MQTVPKLLAFLIAVGILGCGRQRPLTVGAKSFTEQTLLGEIIAQHLEQRLQHNVDRKLDLGGTLLVHQALITRAIDLYPEYTGTALAVILKLPPSPEPGVALERVRMEYRSRWRLHWLDPLGFSSDFAMVIRGADARAHRLETLSDAGRYGKGWVLGAGREFLTRPDGLSALMKTYDLRLRAAPKTIDARLLYQALQKNQVSMAAGAATDGLLPVLDVKVLKDDRAAFPPHQAAIVVHTEALEAHPGLREALDELSGKFSAAIVQKLNCEVEASRRPVREVAREFLGQALAASR